MFRTGSLFMPGRRRYADPDLDLPAGVSQAGAANVGSVAADEAGAIAAADAPIDLPAPAPDDITHSIDFGIDALIPAEVPVAPIERHRATRIGAVLVEAGRLTEAEARSVLDFATGRQLRFGEAGVAMGLLARTDVAYALARQYRFQYIQPGEASLSPKLVAAHQPDHPAIEALRDLRLQLMTPGADGKRARPMVAVVASERRAGCSFVAANLAIVFAQLGLRTLLIDANLRKPELHELFRLDNGRGLSSVLARRSPVDSMHRIAALPRLHVLTAGPIPPNPLELLESRRFDNLLVRADSHFGAVVVDTPPAGTGGEAHRVAARARSTLVVVRRNRSRVAATRQLTDRLVRSRATIAGIVFNDG
jgi:protein-tyrosine kinase